jgi:hypothetical protein
MTVQGEKAFKIFLKVVVELVIGAKNPFALTSHNEVQKFKKKIN